MKLHPFLTGLRRVSSGLICFLEFFDIYVLQSRNLHVFLFFSVTLCFFYQYDLSLFLGFLWHSNYPPKLIKRNLLLVEAVLVIFKLLWLTLQFSPLVSVLSWVLAQAWPLPNGPFQEQEQDDLGLLKKA